jgi:transposase-like protein
MGSSAELDPVVFARSEPDGSPGGLLERLTRCGTPVRVPVGALLPADSPRLGGEDLDHVRILAETAGELPPVLVQRATMRVIDGMHRLQAARRRGDRTIAVTFFDGDDQLAFVAAVAANVTHGLPLPLRDREAAAARILAGSGHWSNRTVAALTGLAPSTVEVIRRRQPATGAGTRVRLGRDGRVRPLDVAAGRRAAAAYLARRPDASLRDVARAAGVSTGTVRDVRRRLAQGVDPVPDRRGPVVTRGEPAQSSRRDRDAIVRDLRRDPSLRFTESGRVLLSWLDIRSRATDGWQKALAELPAHCRYPVAELAEQCADQWRKLARELRGGAGSPEG